DAADVRRAVLRAPPGGGAPARSRAARALAAGARARRRRARGPDDAAGRTKRHRDAAARLELARTRRTAPAAGGPGRVRHGPTSARAGAQSLPQMKRALRSRVAPSAAPARPAPRAGERHAGLAGRRAMNRTPRGRIAPIS